MIKTRTGVGKASWWLEHDLVQMVDENMLLPIWRTLLLNINLNLWAADVEEGK